MRTDAVLGPGPQQHRGVQSTGCQRDSPPREVPLPVVATDKHQDEPRVTNQLGGRRTHVGKRRIRRRRRQKHVARNHERTREEQKHLALGEDAQSLGELLVTFVHIRGNHGVAKTIARPHHHKRERQADDDVAALTEVTARQTVPQRRRLHVVHEAANQREKRHDRRDHRERRQKHVARRHPRRRGRCRGRRCPLTVLHRGGLEAMDAKFMC